jgi:archaellum component FlaC
MTILRSSPVSLLISSSAILPLKRKGGSKQNSATNNADGVSSDLSPLATEETDAARMDLAGGNGEAGPASAPNSRASDKKLQELEANVNDLKKHAETTEMNTKAARNEMESIKKDFTEVNESIKSLLGVYEAVSSQYNPFVDREIPDDKIKGLSFSINGSGPHPRGSGSSKPTDGVGVGVPVDQNGPLDRIVKPDDPDENPIEGVNSSVNFPPKAPIRTIEELDQLWARHEGNGGNDNKGNNGNNGHDQPKPPMIVEKNYSTTDLYALEHVLKLVENQLNKVYHARLKGEELGDEDVEALDRWMTEFRRLGGI